MIKTITPHELKKRLDADEICLIDVREPMEYRTECIKAASLIPLSQITEEKLPLKSKPIVIHCRSGKRSEIACQKLLSENSALDVSSLEGGIIAWKNAGFHTKKSQCKSMAIEHQTQIAVGVITISGVMASVLIHPGFYLIPAFIGAGLIFAGITGSCAMAKLLTKMPWNQ